MNPPERTETFAKLTGNVLALVFWLFVVLVFGFAAYAIWGWGALAAVVVVMLILWSVAGRTKSPHQPGG